MAGKEADVIGGFNSFVTRCRDGSVTNCSVGYIRFDNEIEQVFTEELANVPELTPALYAPRGNTALLDAVGRTVAGVTNNPDDRYIVITFTDGHENASREWTKEKVAALLKAREALGNWTFAFFGADIDAWAESGGMGYAAGNSMSHDKRRMRNAMESSGRVAARMAKSDARSTVHYAAATKAAMDNPDLSDEEIERLIGGNAKDAPAT